jgi:ABC-2 type transport system ATP-binding protein
MIAIEPPDEFAIRTDKLTKRYGKTLATNALDLSVRRGTTFGLLGPNGAGKSSAIRMLMGLSEIDDGSATILGYDVEDRSPELRQRVGYVPELHFIYRWMTVGEVIQFVSALYARWDTTLAEDLLTKFELPKAKKVKALSKGMVAKLGLLVALAHRPELLVLDEPTSGLDPIIREDFLESVLQSDSQGNRSVLFSSHHVDDVERVADDVGIMVDGELVLCDSVDAIRDKVKRIRMVLRDGKLPVDVPPEVIHQRLNRREWTVTVNPFSRELVARIQAENSSEDTTVIDLSLEEIFKDLVRGRKTSADEVA